MMDGIMWISFKKPVQNSIVLFYGKQFTTKLNVNIIIRGII